MKIVIEIPEKTISHIKSDHGHGVKGLRDEDREIVCDAIYASTHYEERPHGEWLITGRKNVFGGFELKCSNCHNTIMVSPDRWEFGENFCDICGSQNKKEGEAE